MKFFCFTRELKIPGWMIHRNRNRRTSHLAA